MGRGRSVRLVVILILLLAAGGVLYTRPINLGLDLQGGIHVVLEGVETPELPLTEDAMNRALAVIDRRVNALGVTEPVLQRLGDRRIIVELPGVEDQEQAIGVIGKTAVLEFKDPTGETVLTGADLANAALGRDHMGRPAVDVEFTAAGAKKFADVTTKWVGHQMPILLDNKVISSPVIQTPITEGKGQITGGFTTESASELVILLRAGSLPVPLEVVEIRNVGPILGQESIDRSLRAGIIGIIGVVLFMLAYYRLPGGIANLALAIYVVLVLAELALVRATLTLPGIAGIILSIGMAVDANVIIFERIKEEVAAGKRARAAVRAGFGRALATVLDANITTLITALVLFNFGTGPIKGFAVTLSLGILTSMFTAIVVTRVFLDLAIDRDPVGFSRYLGVREATK
ncbi:MAG: protein translocase subunit SecD [Firmicutes bacterium]|jgi:preprotein translocase subunit SecD|nr:protein translocase subunit SecD [Bacillota bacterium]